MAMSREADVPIIVVSSSKISRASGSDRARRSTCLPPRCHQPGRRPRLAADRVGRRWRWLIMIDADAIIADTERVQSVALRGEILLRC